MDKAGKFKSENHLINLRNIPKTSTLVHDLDNRRLDFKMNKHHAQTFNRNSTIECQIPKNRSSFQNKLATANLIKEDFPKANIVSKKSSSNIKAHNTNNQQLLLLSENRCAEDDSVVMVDPRRKLSHVRSSILLTQSKKQLKSKKSESALNQLLINKEQKGVKPRSDMIIEEIFKKDKSQKKSKIQSNTTVNKLADILQTNENNERKSSKQLPRKDIVENNNGGINPQSKLKGLMSAFRCFTCY